MNALVPKRLNFLFAALISGLLLGIAWPDTGGLTPLLFVGFIPLLWIQEQVQQARQAGVKRRMFLYTYSAFLLFNIITTWWVWYASPFGAVAAILLNSLFMTWIFGLFNRTRRTLGDKAGYAGLVMYWLGWEYIHLEWDLSWPWLTLGNGFADSVTWVQWYEFTGASGGSLWILLVNILGFRLLRNTLSTRTWSGRQTRAAAFWVLWLALPIIVSAVRYANYEDQGEPLDVVVVQPNVDPYNEKFNGLSSAEQVQRIVTMAEEHMDDSVDYLVAPETAIPDAFDEQDYNQLAEFAFLRKLQRQYPNLQIVIGASTFVLYGEEQRPTTTARKAPQGFWYDYSNTAVHLNRDQRADFYHKSKLVPGVEKMPFPWLFQHFQSQAFDLGGTTGSLAGQKHREAFGSAEDKARVAPIICYESVYGEFVGDYMLHGDANALFIITNDGWWRDTPGHRQHMNYARLRAIEHRKSIARSANTGISGFINQRGDVSQATGWWVPAVIRETIHLNESRTFYTRHGDYLARTSLLFSGFLIIFALGRHLKSKGIRKA